MAKFSPTLEKILLNSSIIDCSLEIISPFTDTLEGNLAVFVDFLGSSVPKSSHVFRGLLLILPSLSA